MKEYKFHSTVVEVICNLKGSKMAVFGRVFESGSDLFHLTVTSCKLLLYVDYESVIVLLPS
jgi:hypothetical protein